MRKGVRLFAAAILASGVVVATLSAGEMKSPVANLVANPGFERADPSNPDRPAGFTPGRVPATGRKARLTWEGPGHNSKKSVAVETLDSNDLGYWETVIPVKPQTEYSLSLYYKCRSVTAGKTSQGDPAYNKGRPGGPNLELGVVPEDESQLAKASSWTDIGRALDPVGGAYLPLVTTWSSHRQTVKTAANQTRMRLKLRVYCYAQKVWFDDLSVVESASLPAVVAVSPAHDSVVNHGKPKFQWKGRKNAGSYLLEYSTSPMFGRDTTTRIHVEGDRFSLKGTLAQGPWFWRVGVADQYATACWLAESSFHVGERTWAPADTTPPAAFSPQPVPNANVNADTTITASFSDVGSDVDPSSARILLDEKDVTNRARITTERMTLRPAKALAKGAHRVTVSVADKAGNRSNTLTWRFGVGKSLINKMRIEGERIFLNDRPYFPIGIYSYSCHPGDGRFSESDLAAASAAGVDCVLNTMPPGLDMLHKHGMKSLLNITNDMKSCDTLASAKVALIEKGQARFRNHPAVLGYWADDPENLEDTKATPIGKGALEKLANTRKVLKQYSPDDPLVWAISNLPRLKDGVRSADILLAYRYPVPQYHPQMICGWTLEYAYSMVGEKPVWFNTQAVDLGYGAPLGCGHKYGTPFKPTDVLRPTPVEMRAMSYYSLVIGVRGLTLYANYLSSKSHPKHWPEALRMANEIRYLAPALAAGKRARTVSLKPESSSASIYFREIEHEGTHTLIAVNMSAGRVGATWTFKKPIRAIVLFEDRAMTKAARQAPDVFGPFEVHIYRW